jgi:hypothetical protein
MRGEDEEEEEEEEEEDEEENESKQKEDRSGTPFAKRQRGGPVGTISKWNTKYWRKKNLERKCGWPTAPGEE